MMRFSSLTSLTRALVRLVSVPLNLVLLAYNLRRLLFTLTILLPRQKKTYQIPDLLPEILLLAPARNEAKMIPALCQAVEQLNYPADRLRVILIDDGSTDGTKLSMWDCVWGKPGWAVFSLEKNFGKAEALNKALRQEAFGDIIYILDADHRPEPSALIKIVKYFQDPIVGGVSGFLDPINPLASPSAYYTSVEGLTHQLLTMRAKDRLNLAPGLLGSNCAYRREALEKCGGFRKGALLEDIDLTLALYFNGYRVRFVEDVRAYHQVPETIDGYLKQHARWGRGFFEVLRSYFPKLTKDKRISLSLRIELLMFSAGYLDRLALFVAACLTCLSLLSRRFFPYPRWPVFISLLFPLGQIMVVFWEQRLPWAFWLRLPLLPIFLILDIAAALRAFIDMVFRRQNRWSETMRHRII